MKSERTFAGWWLVALCGAMVALGGCGGGGKMKTDGGDGGTDADAKKDVPLDVVGDAKVDGSTDADAGGGCAVGDAKRGQGQACECSGQCETGFCAEGICCDSACGEACKTCKAVGSVGTCLSRNAGDPPRVATACPRSEASSCGLDGTCDGAGSCRKYGNNTQCKGGSCEGDQVVGGYACNGAGQCKPGATQICAPFSCNGGNGMCYGQCTSDGQCVSGHKCVDGSCGPKMNGAACNADGECASNHCADGVCCNVACKGACNSCNLNQREGTCWPIDRGVPDPRGRCKDEGAANCGTNGTCDGLGACAKYPRDTICLMPSCSGNRLNTAGSCNGLGTCRAPGVQECPPFRCVNGACTTACETDADCSDGIACVNKTCGPKQDGQVCKAAGECKSNNCVDGVCCESACTGACRSCNLPTTPGRCVAIAAGNDDTRKMCMDAGAASCGTTGKCDGAGGCQRYAAGTVCADEKCEVKVYTPPSTCNATGQCVTPDQQPCQPFLCNGKKCFAACTIDTQCQSPNTCVLNSCGKKPDGASCSSPDECMHNACEQGICCATACKGPCRSCALSGSLGTCTNVATGSLDPAEMCGPDAASTCARNGKCEGGACQRYGVGTSCRDPSCPAGSTMFTGVSGCDGAGTCVTPGATSCFPYLCGGTACKGTCMADVDCASPAVCINGSCGLKPNGAICTGGQECLSAICEQGVCCSTSCGGTCKSCALPNARGTCTNVPTGDVDPHGNCTNMGPASCKTDGFCDGSGACRLYDASTSCAAPSCASSPTPTLTSGRTCDGRGTCQAASSIACAPYVCNGSTACKAACTGNDDCLTGNICDTTTSRCGKARLGQACTTTNDCLTGNSCVDGVCCSTASCPTCQACNVQGSAGNCANVAINAPEPHGFCAATPPCGNTGSCNGLGGCQQAGTAVSCGTASCSGSTYTPLSHCNGSGACAAPISMDCGAYVCGGGVCKTTCTADGDCVAPFTCQGSGTTKSCAKKANGLACSAANQCISGNCLDNVCCGSASCPTCQACNVNGQGSCAPLPNGAAAPGNQCPAAPPCGNTGACNGAGGCQQQSSSISCASPSCTGSNYTAPGMCTGSGTCGAQTTSSCSPYTCGNGNACKKNCNTNADCINTTYYCTGNGGSCLAKKGPGVSCGSANECSTGNCVDGVCCGSASCPTCQACNLASAPGTCTNIPAGQGDLHAGCPTGGTCGNTGVCSGAGACQQVSSTVQCGGPACSGSTFTAAVNCTGTGSCPTQTQSSCAPYICGTNACKTNCNSNSDCISSSYYCTGTGGMCLARKGNGASCGAGNECSSNSCVDNVCCGTSSCPTCKACNLNGLGSCTDVDGAVDPHGRCAPSSTCGNTGLCESGACQQALTNVPCGNPLCNGTAFTPTAYCNGNGGCSTPTTVACTPFVCGTNNACLGTCGNDNDCANGYFCAANSQCQAKKNPGASCGTGHECGSNNCVDNVCCTSSACDPCKVCNLSGNGTCTAGPNSDNRCNAPGTCGDTGICQGGLCQKEPNTTVCGAAATCTNAGPISTFQPATRCNGNGGCSLPPLPQTCGLYTCTTSGCRTDCSGDGDCVTGYYCSGGSCVQRAGNSESCTAGNQCASGHCTEGVCCDKACSPCGTCVLPLNVGTCTPLGPGTVDPGCNDDGPQSCGNNGKCDGAGSCDRYPAGTVCNRLCSDGGATYTVSLCDGSSLCTPLLTTTCMSMMCDPQSGCAD